MALLEWTDAMAVEMPAMDQTHQEFVALLNALESASDEALIDRYVALLAHTDAHFAREDAWMQATGFAASNCHSMQHKIVMDVLREGEKRGRAGDLEVLRVIARELAQWFPQHTDAMDAALAQHLLRTGFDPATGSVTRPEALPRAALHGCGGASCTDPEDLAPAGLSA
jgi:hemerythrin-like metal-binding protein